MPALAAVMDTADKRETVMYQEVVSLLEEIKQNIIIVHGEHPIHIQPPTVRTITAVQHNTIVRVRGGIRIIIPSIRTLPPAATVPLIVVALGVTPRLPLAVEVVAVVAVAMEEAVAETNTRI